MLKKSIEAFLCGSIFRVYAVPVCVCFFYMNIQKVSRTKLYVCIDRFQQVLYVVLRCREGHQHTHLNQYVYIHTIPSTLDPSLAGLGKGLSCVFLPCSQLFLWPSTIFFLFPPLHHYHHWHHFNTLTPLTPLFLSLSGLNVNTLTPFIQFLS